MPEELESKVALLIWSRRGVIAAGLAFSTSAIAGPLKRRPRRVLFLCQAGTVKSPLGRELLRRGARARGLRLSTSARGIAIADHVSPQLRQRLVVEGIDLKAERPKQFVDRDWQAADIVVAFNRLPDHVKPRDLRDWTDISSINDDYDNSRPMLDARIAALLDEIEQLGR